MTPDEMHKAAVSKANTDTLRKFNVYGPYKPGSAEHAFWLKSYDSAMRALLQAHKGRDDK